MQRFSKQHFFRKEAIQQRYTRHRRRCHHGQGRGIGHVTEQAVEFSHVTRTGLVIDNSGGHKQRCLKNSVVNHVKHGSDGSQLCIQTK